MPPGGPWRPAQRYWHGTEPEWDCVAESVDGKRVLLAECKWTATAHSTADLRHFEAGVQTRSVPPSIHVNQEVSRAVFVPALPDAHPRSQNVSLVTAQEVLEALTY